MIILSNIYLFINTDSSFLTEDKLRDFQKEDPRKYLLKRNKQQKEAYDAAWRIIRGETAFESIYKIFKEKLDEFERFKEPEGRAMSEDAKPKTNNIKSLKKNDKTSPKNTTERICNKKIANKPNTKPIESSQEEIMTSENKKLYRGSFDKNNDKVLEETNIASRKTDTKSFTVEKERSKSNGATGRFSEHKNKNLGNLTSSNIDSKRNRGYSINQLMPTSDHSSVMHDCANAAEDIKIVAPMKGITQVKVNNEQEDEYNMELETIPIDEMVQAKTNIGTDSFL